MTRHACKPFTPTKAGILVGYLEAATGPRNFILHKPDILTLRLQLIAST